MLTSSRYMMPATLNDEEKRFKEVFADLVKKVTIWGPNQPSIAEYIIETLYTEATATMTSYDTQQGVPHYINGKCVMLFWLLKYCRNKGIGNHNTKLIIKRTVSIKELKRNTIAVNLYDTVNHDNSIFNSNIHVSTLSIANDHAELTVDILTYVMKRMAYEYHLENNQMTLYKLEGA